MLPVTNPNLSRECSTFATTSQYSSIPAWETLRFTHGKWKVNRILILKCCTKKKNTPDLEQSSILLCAYTCHSSNKPTLNLPEIMRNIHERGLTLAKTLQHWHIKQQSNRPFMCSNDEKMKVEGIVYESLNKSLILCKHTKPHTRAILHLFVFLLGESYGRRIKGTGQTKLWTE